MKKMICAFLFIAFSLNVHAQEFTGCGEYLFKGVLRRDKTVPLKFNYIVRENSQSQMSFSLKDSKDVLGILDQPSSFKAKILKKMDGTSGEIVEVREIGLRSSKPLSIHDTEIVKIKDLKCD